VAEKAKERQGTAPAGDTIHGKSRRHGARDPIDLTGERDAIGAWRKLLPDARCDSTPHRRT
jgi:hypothetical protein